MYWYHYLSLGCLFICLSACLWHFFRLIRLGKPKDLSQKSGSIPRAELYSYTIAMLPTQKESAYLHIPTFTAGVLFHIGTFVALLLFLVFFFVNPILLRDWLLLAIGILFAILLLGISVVCGGSLFFKRLFLRKLRTLSTMDDYVSVLLVTLFQLVTIFYLIFGDSVATYYYITASILLLYMPVGKLRHAVYFFAARYQLGFFYGWRNAWPLSKKRK
jgi:nitrate reductase gamma subunit